MKWSTRKAVACKQGGKCQLKHGYENKILEVQTSTVEICLSLIAGASFKNTRIFSVAHNETHVGYWKSEYPHSKTTIKVKVKFSPLQALEALRVVRG
jgi:hypothetical protein